MRLLPRASRVQQKQSLEYSIVLYYGFRVYDVSGRVLS